MPDPTKYFSAQVEAVKTYKSSGLLVTWKRVYVEVSDMYEKGAILTNVFNMTVGTGNDTIKVDSVDDFKNLPALTDIVLFDKDGIALNTKLVSVDEANSEIIIQHINPIIFDNRNINFMPKYTGVKITNETSKLDTVPLSDLDDVYGKQADGQDGGAFVEFYTIAGLTAPKYKTIPTAIDGSIFAQRWFKHFDSKKNVFQMLSAHQSPAILGVADVASNATLVCGYDLGGLISAADAVPHEHGHCFGLYKEMSVMDSIPETEKHHVDAYENKRNFSNSDECQMSYNRNSIDGKLGFCQFCVHHVRRQKSPY